MCVGCRFLFLVLMRRKKKQLTPKEEFLMGLTAEDTVQVLTISRSCMDTLKAGNIDEALKMLLSCAMESDTSSR
mgnify:CR=1 FL=1